MEQQEVNYGLVKFSHFLPTVSALRYLNCCRTAGWHRCNKLYHLRYEAGVSIVFVLYTVRGSGWVQAGTSRWELKEGTLVVVPPNVYLEYATSDNGDRDFWEFYWMNLDGDFVRRTAEKLWEDGLVLHQCLDREYFRQSFHWLLHTNLPEKSREIEHSRHIQEMFQDLLAERVFGRRGNGSASAFAGGRNSTMETAFPVEALAASEMVAEQMLEVIQSEYAKGITLEEFSRRFFLSKNQLIRIFRKRTGYAPYEYIKRYRLMKACELLQGTALPVNEVGDRVGYGNNSHFAAQFKDCYGMTTTEYRRMFSHEAE